VYSPDIDEFSESEDIFHVSQESQNITAINNGIVESHMKKAKYRPMNKVPKAGGLLEKLRTLKNKRLMDASSFAKSSLQRTNQRKIQVIQHSPFRRQLLVNFKFIDELATDENHRFMVLPLDFTSFITKHCFFDVVFDLTPQEFQPKHLMYFGKKLRAARQF
jgi:hypothetical protein